MRILDDKGAGKMRQLETIQTKENLNQVYAEDEKGAGGANHVYSIVSVYDPDAYVSQEINFQDGPRNNRSSIHGALDSDLLEIARDRMKCFQEGDFATEDNAKALEHIEKALYFMNQRVEKRIARNVLGTYKK